MIIDIKEKLMRAGYPEGFASSLALEIDEAFKNEAENKETKHDEDMLLIYTKAMDKIDFDHNEVDG